MNKKAKDLDISLGEVAQTAGLSTQTLLRWISKNEIPVQGFCHHLQRFLPLHHGSITSAAGNGSDEVKALFAMPFHLEMQMEHEGLVDKAITLHHFKGEDREIFTYFVVHRQNTLPVKQILIRRSHLRRFSAII